MGFAAESALKSWFADMMFFSVNSVDAENGLTDQGEEIAQVKMAMLQQAKHTVLLADSGKFGHTSAYRLAPADVTTIVTDENPIFEQPCWKEYRQKMVFAK